MRGGPVDWFVKEIVGLFLWLVANAVYLGAVRRGEGGFRRLVAFWIGLPGTFVTLVAVKEGSQPVVEPPPDDDAALLEDVRRSRALEPAEEDDHNRGREEAR